MCERDGEMRQDNNKKVISVLVNLLLGTLLIIVAGIIAGKHFFGIEFVKPYVVQSGSMEPAIKTGSVIFSVPSKNYNPGDVITFKPGGEEKNLVTHRIEFKLYPEGTLNYPLYMTSGDANENFDRWEVWPEDILGKVTFSVPYLGYAVDFAKKPYGFILLVIIPATIVIYEELKVLTRESVVYLKKVTEEVSIRRFFPKRKKKVITGEIERNFVEVVERTINLSPKKQGVGTQIATMFLPIMGATLVMFSLSSSFFSDVETSAGNVFQASDHFGPPIAQTLVMNELLPFSSCNSGQTNGQFLELWNGSGATVNLKDFKLTDGSVTIAIANSNTNLSNNAFAILVKSNGVINQCLGGNVNGAITVNLGGTLDLNTGQLRLLDTNNITVDTIKWGIPPNPQPSINKSIERSPKGADSALGINFEPSDFVIPPSPSPGLGL